MPFIRGRYHINAIAGEALEAAREEEAALRALEQAAREHEAAQESGGGDGANNGGGNGKGANSVTDDDEFGAGDDANNSSAQNGAARGPIRRVEIEAAELVPAHSGRAGRGIVARVHRGSDAANSGTNTAGAIRRAAAGPETHVFSSHGDMLNFLRDEFAKDARRGAARARR